MRKAVGLPRPMSKMGSFVFMQWCAWVRAARSDPCFISGRSNRDPLWETNPFPMRTPEAAVTAEHI